MEKKSSSDELMVTITMTRPVAEAVKLACEMYLRLHMGQFEDLTEDLCMAKFYSDLERNAFRTENSMTMPLRQQSNAEMSCVIG